MRPVQTATFRGKRWRIEWSKMRRKCGECEAPDAPEKTIRINPDLAGRELLETLIHESLHAALWILDEPTIDATARDTARFIWRLMKAGKQ